MDTRVKFVLTCLMVLIVSPLFSTAARQSATTSRDIEIERYLARVNKPFVKSIKIPDGDTIDCVLIADQPAFDHPLLKNHTIKMWPSNYSEEGSKNGTRRKAKFQLWQLYGSCPKGTVPIIRTTKEDVLRARSIEEYGQKPSNYSVAGVGDAMRWYATVDANEPETGDLSFGGRAKINVWQPQIEPIVGIFSLTQIWVVAGGPNMNTLEAGWQVYPDVYGDSKPRLFIYYTNNSYRFMSGCYNLKCSGFVQVNHEVALGGEILPVSSYKGKQYDVSIEISKDAFFDHNWWLRYQDVLVGYWPYDILPLLSKGATTISWGGEVVGNYNDGRHTTTGMGSGHFPEEGFRKASYVKNMEVLNRHNQWVAPGHLVPIVTQSKCYNIKLGYGGSWGDYFYYGGPGRNSKCA